jgi:hypothetical protein
VTLEQSILEPLITLSLPNDIVLGAGGALFSASSGIQATYTGNISGNHPLIVSGMGVTILAGNSSSTALTTFAAPLSILRGTLTGDVLVSADSTLEASGACAALTVEGTLAPAPGFSVQGPYIQTGSLQVSVPGNEQNGSLAVEGDVTLAGNLIVSAHPSGVYAKGSTYTLIEAPKPHTLTGSFDQVISPILSVRVDYIQDPQVILTVLEQVVWLQTAPVRHHNPQSVFHYLRALTLVPDSDLVTILNAMDSTDSSLFTDELDELHPAPFGAFDLLQLQANSQITALLTRPHSAPCPPCREEEECERRPASVWLAPIGLWYQQDKRGEQVGFDAVNGGVLAGVDYRCAGGLLLGLGGGYTWSHLNWEEKRGSGALDSGILGFYLDNKARHGYIELSALGTFSNETATRHIAFAKRHARHTITPWSITAHFGFGGDFSLGKTEWNPFVRADYLYQSSPAFTERGAGSLDLHVKGRVAQQLRSEVGLAISYPVRIGRQGCVVPTLFCSGINECFLSSPHYTAQLVDHPETFTVRTWSKPLYLLSPGMDIVCHLDTGLALALHYAAEVGGSALIQTADVRVAWTY